MSRISMTEDERAVWAAAFAASIAAVTHVSRFFPPYTILPDDQMLEAAECDADTAIRILRMRDKLG